MDKTKVTKDLQNKTLTIEREFNAPKAKLWNAYADKETFAKWWGPEGWETTIKEFNFAPGGRNHYCMKCTDEAQGQWFGQESWGLMEYGDMSEPDRFTYKDAFTDETGVANKDMPLLTVDIELKEQDGKTTVVSVVHGDSAEDIEKLLAMGMIEGFSSSADKLERLVTQQ
jgi:uncharacterized protein YndB with AHSA1/START domain